ncbi:MAG: hypothetical protein HQL24_06650 [Candidatus Omnitrophica bacterium]|nr:hypothetical protein [Candidatus Omnitrophota bacterium]
MRRSGLIIKKKIAFKNVFCFMLFGLLFLSPLSLTPAYPQQYDATHYPHADLGTIDFIVKPLKANFSDSNNFVLFQASSSDGKEFYEIQIIGDDVLVFRDFGQCLRSMNRGPHDFKQGGVYKLTLTWNGPSTKFFINDGEMKGFNLVVNGDSYQHSPFVKFGESDNFEISDVNISSESNMSVASADQDFADHHQCPQLAKLLDEKAQEEYKGISLFGFPDQESRDQVKSYIDLLPEAVAGSLKRIIFVDEGQRLGSAQGLTTSEDTFFLRQGYEPSTFFHESTHVYDIRHNENSSKEWGEKFLQKEDHLNFAAASTDLNHRSGSILGNLDGSSPSEQLAQFTGIVYDFYLKNKTSADLIAAFGPQAKEQLDFLLSNGFITRKIYDQLNMTNH